MDFVIGLENSVLNLPERQVKFFFFWGGGGGGEFKLQKNSNQSCSSK